MKTKIIYYSYSGNTRRVARLLSDILAENGEVEFQELKAADESKNFFIQGRRALKKIRAVLEETSLDFSGYDLVCFGTPVWAFGPTPAMWTCLDKASGLDGKEVILFTTSGGSGDKRCLNTMQEILAQKGAASFKRFSVPAGKIKDKELILSKIKEATRLWPNG